MLIHRDFFKLKHCFCNQHKIDLFKNNDLYNDHSNGCFKLHLSIDPKTF